MLRCIKRKETLVKSRENIGATLAKTVGVSDVLGAITVDPRGGRHAPLAAAGPRNNSRSFLAELEGQPGCVFAEFSKKFKVFQSFLFFYNWNILDDIKS